MSDDLNEMLERLALRIFVLNHKLGCWYMLARDDLASTATLQAGRKCETDAQELLNTIKQAVHYRT